MYVVLPTAYDPNQRYPVLYVLHGASGSYKDWVKQTRIVNFVEPYRMILVFPDGGQYGWYVDSPKEPKSQYESYFVKEHIPYIDSHYSTIADRSGRGIVGLSMGGHGAITLAIKHPDLFGSASSLSGVLDLTRHKTEWQIFKRLGMYAENPAQWDANSALQLAPKLSSGTLSPDTPLQLFVDCGTEDFAIAENRAFRDRLQELDIPLFYVERPGNHNWAYWNGNIGEHLAFHSKAFAATNKK